MIIALIASLFAQQVTPDAPSIMPAFTKDIVEIRQDFAGEELILFGATQGLTIQDEIVVILRGPAQDLRVMRRARTFGIWVNTAPRDFEDVPSYYAVSSTRPLAEIADPEALINRGIGLQNLMSDTAAADDDTDRAYRQAVERAGIRNALYVNDPVGVEVLDGGLFRARLALPPVTPVGTYNAEVYLFRDGRPIANRTISLYVEKAGIERWVYDFAHQWPLLYGLACVILAAFAGWAAASAFNRR